MIDPTPTPYTSAAFRTDRDALGLTVSMIATALGVADVTVWQYQSANRAKPVPDRVRDFMRTYRIMAASLARDLAAADGPLVRPADDDALDLLHPDLAGWGVHAFGLILDEAREIRADRGIVPEIVWAVAPTPDAA